MSVTGGLVPAMLMRSLSENWSHGTTWPVPAIGIGEPPYSGASADLAKHLRLGGDLGDTCETEYE